jgi:hypothetical protein
MKRLMTNWCSGWGKRSPSYRGVEAQAAGIVHQTNLYASHPGFVSVSFALDDG